MKKEVVFDAELEAIKKKVKEENLFEIKEKRKKELLASQEMYKNTLEEASKKNNNLSLELIKKANDEIENELLFLENANDVDLVHYFVDKYSSYNSYGSNLNRNYLKEIKEPLRVNQYLVELPVCFGILPNEVVEFNWDSEQVILKIRESIDSHQLQKAYDLLKSKNHIIIFKQLKPDLSVDYTINFKNCQLNHIQVITSSYNNDNVKCFYLILKYKELMFV